MTDIPIRPPADAGLVGGSDAFAGPDAPDGSGASGSPDESGGTGDRILDDEGGAGPDGGAPPASVRARLVVPASQEDFRAGFACLVGRPNAGKSTLTNALVGTKVAITSGRPQTTRHNVRGVVHRESSQLVLVDTPGLHRPRTLLGRRLNDLVRETLVDVDAIVFCIPANEKVGPGDRRLARPDRRRGHQGRHGLQGDAGCPASGRRRPRPVGRHRPRLGPGRLPGRCPGRRPRLPPAPVPAAVPHRRCH